MKTYFMQKASTQTHPTATFFLTMLLFQDSVNTCKNSYLKVTIISLKAH